MFGRRKQTVEASPVRDQADRPGAKNRPTPSRREQEAARKRPLVETDRKAAAKQARLAARDERVRARQALLSGDEAHLPARDRGPVRRFIRDVVDSRWNVGEFLLPVMVVVLALSFVRQSWAQLFVFLAVYLLILVGVIDASLMWRRTRKAIEARFGQSAPKGSAMYAVMRAFQIRRSRLPRPQVERGAKVL
ncbi:MAG TPA: DUF3043 domain-containing protein [Dermatophilaceae bacterium]|nr:DUF3043 domain-containing protein [Dermatophilaceae bacterium]